ncbi:MAG TPA: DUF1345 domain-containing protein [Acetobacteraceae bacterium]|nr:DUF1345 domain-containing protein [Acetobacteraceae bacterium]
MMLLRIIRARPRLFTGFAIALVSFFLLPHPIAVTTRAVLAWDIGAVVFLALTLIFFLRSDHTRIAADAEAQEEGEWSLFVLTLGGTLMSLFALLTFAHVGQKDPHHGLYMTFVGITLVSSWLMTHTTFAYRYAHEYYARSNGVELDRGLDFPGEQEPDYFDFVYFSFVLGMTFQVSDVEVTARKLRRMATVQGLIGFVFNTVILALSVNIAAGLI